MWGGATKILDWIDVDAGKGIPMYRVQNFVLRPWERERGTTCNKDPLAGQLMSLCTLSLSDMTIFIMPLAASFIRSHSLCLTGGSVSFHYMFSISRLFLGLSAVLSFGSRVSKETCCNCIEQFRVECKLLCKQSYSVTSLQACAVVPFPFDSICSSSTSLILT